MLAHLIGDFLMGSREELIVPEPSAEVVADLLDRSHDLVGVASAMEDRQVSVGFVPAAWELSPDLSGHPSIPTELEPATGAWSIRRAEPP